VEVLDLVIILEYLLDCHVLGISVGVILRKDYVEGEDDWLLDGSLPDWEFLVKFIHLL